MLEDKKTPQLLGRSNTLADSFRRDMESMVSKFFGGASPFFPMETAAQRTGFPSLDMTGAISPAIDVHETDTEITLTAELPGLSEDDVDVEVKDRRLMLRGQKNISHEDTGDLHVSERSYGSFARTMTLPEAADLEKITAEFDKGVLYVTIPKTEAPNPSQKIKVSSK